MAIQDISRGNNMVHLWLVRGQRMLGRHDHPFMAPEKTLAVAALFANVPERDYLNFGHGEQFNAKAVAELLNLKKQEVSKISQVAETSVRYDNAIPQKVRERLEEIGTVINLVAGIFDGDADKTALWFKTNNPMLGEVSPRDMIRLGRYDKLRKFIVSALTEQARESAHARKVAGGETK